MTARILHRCFSVVSHIQSQVERGQLRHDLSQLRAAKRLDRLREALVSYDNQEVQRYRDALKRNESEDKKKEEPQKDTIALPPPPPKIPRGLYIYGPVGAGKSMLMDTFYKQSCSSNKKQRFHFHAFMKRVHDDIVALKKHDLELHGRDFGIRTERNPILRVGQALSHQLSLLCLDEFQVTDVADAMILSQLFGVLFANGTVLVATSNRPPLDLYRNGINRGYFLPFIDLLQRYCIVHHLESMVDYRELLRQLDTESFYFQEAHQLKEVVDELCPSGFEAVDLTLGWNRTLTVWQGTLEAKSIVNLDFDEICNVELGASDYRQIARRYAVVILRDIPVLTTLQHNQARRFITLVDECYEARVALICSAATDPDSLFVKIQNVEHVEHGFSAGAEASLDELHFAFARAVSRIKQMTTPRWVQDGLERMNE